MNKKLVSLVAIAAITFTSVSPVFAKNFTSKQNVALTHTWTVKFNKTLGSNQDFSKVTIKDSKGTVVPLDVTVGSDNKSVKVAPKENYNSNTNYTLTVDGMKDSSGKVLKENATMQFTTASDSTNQPSSIIRPELLDGAEGRADKVWYQCFGSVKDQNGNPIPLNSYALGQVYTYEQAKNFQYSYERNNKWCNDDDDYVISGLGCQMKFDNNKLYVENIYPINVTALPPYRSYGTATMIRYINPINPLAEQQIYNLVSNVARTNDTVSSKYTLIYNSQYATYKADANGNLIKVPSARENTTDFYLQLMSQDANASGAMTEYADVYFLETPYIANGINYNLKFMINPESFPKETKILIKSIVGNKFGDDLVNEVLNKFKNKIFDNTPFIVDNVKCYINDGYVYISY